MTKSINNLKGLYLDATIENFKGLVEDYPNLKFEWNMCHSVKYDTYMYIDNDVMKWSHYRTIGVGAGGTPSNENIEKAQYIDEDLIILKDFMYDKTEYFKDKPNFMLNGEKKSSLSDIDKDYLFLEARVVLRGKLTK